MNHHGLDPQKLKWHIPENLRWLAEECTVGYLPSGDLSSAFLKCVADRFERQVERIRVLTDELDDIRARKTSPNNQDTPHG